MTTPRSGLGAASTVYPSACSCSTTAFQLELSAHAPCTSTIVGLGALVALEECLAVAVVVAAVAEMARPVPSSVPAMASEARAASEPRPGQPRDNGFTHERLPSS